MPAILTCWRWHHRRAERSSRWTSTSPTRSATIPAETAGIVVLRVRDRPGASDLDATVEQLIEAFEVADVTERLWIVDRSRVREYRDRAE